MPAAGWNDSSWVGTTNCPPGCGGGDSIPRP